MRINVYTEELINEEIAEMPRAEIVTAEYVSSRTGLPMKNYGLRIFLKSAPELHYIPGRDDDRSAVTFWCGEKEKNVFEFLEKIRVAANASTLKLWHDKTEKQIKEAVEAENERNKNG